MQTTLILPPRATLAAAVSLGLLAAALPAAHSPAQTITFSNLADTTTAAPGQSSNFSGFNSPAISGSNVAFGAFYDSFNGSGLYTDTTGNTSPSRVADSSTAVPGQSGNFDSSFSRPAISGSNVAFGANYGGFSSEGIYTGLAGTTGASRVVDYSTPVPGQSGNFINLGFNPAISGSTVAFQGNYSGGSGIYTGTAGSTGAVRLADGSLAVPGQSGNFSSFGDSPAISGSTVAFRGNYSGGSGIYTATVGGTGASRVADNTTPVPGQSGNFTNLNTPAISGSTVAFQGFYSGGEGIYTGVAGTTGASLVADTSTAVPGQSGFTFEFFPAFALSGDNVAFLAFYNSFNSNGLFLRLDGSLVDVIAPGDALFGSTVSSVNFANFGLDGTTLAFSYTLANGVRGIALANVVPEPGTYALALAGGAVGLFGAVRRQRRLGRRRA